MKKKMPKSSALSKISVGINTGCKSVRFDRKKIILMVRKIAKQFGVKKAAIDITVADDKEIIKVNRQFFKTGKITDVISFDLSDRKGDKVYDIIVNGELAQRQAKLRGHSTQAELALYIVHGMLHNLGFDDLSEAKAKKMHKAEDALLEKFGYGIVYNKKLR